MTAPDVIRGLNLAPLDGRHRTVQGAARRGDALLDLETIENVYAHEWERMQEYYALNLAAYQNRREHERQNPTQLRVISEVGLDLLASLGLAQRGRGAPVFRYFPPKDLPDGTGRAPSIRARRSVQGGPRSGSPEGISFVVMHSFGRGFDQGNIRRNNSRTSAVDPETGHNPRRFFNGVQTLTRPRLPSDGPDHHVRSATIHHMISLRGDLINSVSWDNRCIHAGRGRNESPMGGSNPYGIAEFSIGIEHEEFYITQRPGARIQEIRDHGPYSEPQFAIDAFILKKLAAYTGRDFTQFLGVKDQLRSNIENRAVGCFSHAATSQHADPGAQFYIPPDWAIGDSVDTIANAEPHLGFTLDRPRPARWSAWLERWYANATRGTKISAWDRIFSKVERLRAFNLQSEVFDPSLGGGRINVVPPAVTGDYTQGAAQAASRDRLASYDRSERMANQARSNLYSRAQTSSSASATALARGASRLNQISETSVRLPVIINALGFDFETGLWVNRTTVNRESRGAETDDSTAVVDDVTDFITGLVD